MKIYNIHHPKAFFEALSDCSGRIELIDAGGKAIKGDGIADFCRFAESLTSVIPEIQLRFEDANDCKRMMRYATWMNIA